MLENIIFLFDIENLNSIKYKVVHPLPTQCCNNNCQTDVRVEYNRKKILKEIYKRGECYAKQCIIAIKKIMIMINVIMCGVYSYVMVCGLRTLKTADDGELSMAGRGARSVVKGRDLRMS